MSGTMPILFTTWSKYYLTPPKQTVEEEVTDTPSTSNPPGFGPLNIEIPSNDFVI